MTTYYVSPNGSGTTCSNDSPCTLATGLSKSLIGDDHLILKDGTYTNTNRDDYSFNIIESCVFTTFPINDVIELTVAKQSYNYNTITTHIK